ncbi:putative nucleocapsid [Plasmopara viticola lesion associated mononegaambi virus 2]|uniref:Nucleocapsid n=1 Tax=Plasmopara viticola lesion associated mononegaambi virus 2 TaxID=2692014 RepID=A0A6B9Q4R1_9MONO|nr:putative nucleocapsid [Plasmopara viticola lesion associated mononegaambi virus 2]
MNQYDKDAEHEFVMSHPQSYQPMDQPHRKVLAAIILPTATGKSFLVKQGLPPHVKEADHICHVRETYLLSEFRDDAKVTGDWSRYDKQLAAHLRLRANDGDIILLASSDLAVALDSVILGTCILGRQLWENNVLTRGQPVSKYEGCYNAALKNAEMISDSYGDLYNRVMDLIAVWDMYMEGIRHERKMTPKIVVGN